MSAEPANLPMTKLNAENLRVYVVHYTQLAERRAHSEQILAETGLDAFQVRWVTEWDREAVLEGGRYDRGEWGEPRKIAAGSISLILKHVSAWESVMAEPNCWHLILEDDLLVPPWSGRSWIADLEQILNQLPADNWDLVFVGLGCDLHVPWWKRLGKVGARVYWRGWRPQRIWGGGGCSRCTEAYLIHPAFARRLLDSHWSKAPFDRPIDWLLNGAGVEFKARSYWAEPPLVTQGAFESWTKDRNLNPSL
jgi:hypothetical protein